MEDGDDHMRAGRPAEALQAYQDAWSKLPEGTEETEKVWLLLSIANAAVRAEEYEEAFGAFSTLHPDLSDTGLVVGNPLFHLLVGLCFHGLEENEEGMEDNLARALICGGPEIFAGEDPEHLEQTMKHVKAPTEEGTWSGYAGVARDRLNGSTGYLRELIKEKLEQPPPYRDDDEALGTQG